MPFNSITTLGTCGSIADSYVFSAGVTYYDVVLNQTAKMVLVYMKDFPHGGSLVLMVNGVVVGHLFCSGHIWNIIAQWIC